ncbi:unnamed protein product [Prorocentrum cordatum]|uniref:Uncharacterized protein n=1 Tax=Prorocentrum cordatum TaxID=2364126 RepID=A0ABN9TDT8_9DINO|nr:unnamed protein product [Polarella glacialis]
MMPTAVTHSSVGGQRALHFCKSALAPRSTRSSQVTDHFRTLVNSATAQPTSHETPSGTQVQAVKLWLASTDAELRPSRDHVPASARERRS